MIAGTVVVLGLLGVIMWLCKKLDEACATPTGPLVIKIGSDVLLRAETSDEMSHVVDCYFRLKRDDADSREAAREQRSEETAGLVLGGYIAGYRQAEADHGTYSADTPDLATVHGKAKEWILNGQPGKVES
jgi:hypothetical protein